MVVGLDERCVVMLADDLIWKELNTFRSELQIPREASHHEVVTMLRIIHERLFDPEMNVARLREWAGLRNHNISCLFKRSIGVDIRTYVEELRMAAAARLLRHGIRFSIFLVAMEIGYNSPELFSRTFRRHFGCAPSQFRDRIRDSGGEAGSSGRMKVKTTSQDVESGKTGLNHATCSRNSNQRIRR